MTHFHAMYSASIIYKINTKLSWLQINLRRDRLAKQEFDQWPVGHPDKQHINEHWVNLIADRQMSPPVVRPSLHLNLCYNLHTLTFLLQLSARLPKITILVAQEI